MFNNHSMYLVTNTNDLNTFLRNPDVAIAAITTERIELPNVYNTSVLMPPTGIIMRWADGDPVIMQNEYPKYLDSYEADSTIVALIAALTKRDVVLYIPNDEFMVYGNALLYHLYFRYGLTVATPQNQFNAIPAMIPFIMSKLYMYDYMTPNDYLEAYPSNQQLPGFVIYKLAQDMNPLNWQSMPFANLADYFNNLNRSKQNSNPIVIAKMIKENPNVNIPK